MSASKSSKLSTPLPDRLERVAMIIGALAIWTFFALLFRFADRRDIIFISVLCGPCVPLFTYFALDGDIPLRFRQKGFRPVSIISLVFCISIVAAVVVGQFLPQRANQPSTNSAIEREKTQH